MDMNLALGRRKNRLIETGLLEHRKLSSKPRSSVKTLRLKMLEKSDWTPATAGGLLLC